MCRRPLAGFFSRMCTGTPMASPNCPAAAQTRQCGCHCSKRACCLCPVTSGHALRAVQPASESACSFLFLQPSVHPSVHSFCTPSLHLLYTFCTPFVHLLHILYISGRSTNPISRLVVHACRTSDSARRGWPQELGQTGRPIGTASTGSAIPTGATRATASIWG